MMILNACYIVTLFLRPQRCIFWIKHLKPWPSKHCDPAGALLAFIRGSYQDMSMTKLQTINELYTHHTISYQCSHTCIHYIQNQQNTKSSITIIDLLVLFVVWQYLRNILINRTEAWFDACERMWKKVNLVSDSSRQLDLANFSVPLVYLPHIGPHRAPSLDPTSWPFLPRCLKDQNVLSILVAQLGGFHEDVRHLQQNLLGSSPTDGGFLTWYPQIILFPNHPAFLGYPIVGKPAHLNPPLPESQQSRCQDAVWHGTDTCKRWRGNAWSGWWF